MLKTSLALAAAALTALAPLTATAQDAEVPAARAPFQPISYDVQEDRENILLLDLSNGDERPALFQWGNRDVFIGPDQPKEVPDPWYEDNFDVVYGMIEEATTGLLRTL